MMKKGCESQFLRVLDEFRPKRRYVCQATCSKLVNVDTKTTRVNDYTEPLNLLFVAITLRRIMTLVSTMKVNIVCD